jgi:hypothetical protein
MLRFKFTAKGLQKRFLFRGSGWDSWTEPTEVEVEEKGALEMGQPSLWELF